ncbi:uncharacterized protein [Halyomorpha halys]|uniref:uncharacterized protein isoform X3 n=1 Tax=Halyomorpha halys TaxID=286706 RepID=UPI0006D4CA1C|nr:uncharacterized protein LOC106687799 isoform X2 [Halyomorpha halys]
MEEMEQLSGCVDLDEESKEDDSVEKGDVFRKHENYKEPYYGVLCCCNDKSFFGRKCECFMIKEDIRTLFSLGEFIDNLIAGQKKALQIPLEQSKLYNMLDMVFESNFKFGDCVCEQDEESNYSEKGQSSQKDTPPSCQCQKLPKKRCVLRIIRNDVFQRMKLVKKLNFLLMEKNKKIKEMMRKREKNNPGSPYVTKSICYDETVHRLIERYHLLKEMKEEDVPNTCLFDKKELLDHIGHHRILTKPLRHIYLVEELADKVRKKIQKDSDSEKCNTLDKSYSVTDEEDKCRCPETDKKIEFIKNFKSMIARLNPILDRKEESLDFSKKEEKTIEQLVKSKQKEKREKLANLVHNRRVDVQLLMHVHMKIEEEILLKETIKMLLSYIKQVKDELQAYEDNQESNEAVAKFIDESGSNQAFAELINSNQMDASQAVEILINEKKELEELAALLEECRGKYQKPLDDERPMLEEINEKLQDYLEKQRKYFNEMEKFIPGFKIAIFDEELKKERIIEEICRDDEEMKSGALKEAKKYEPEGRERLRMLLKGLNKPHLHIIGCPLESVKGGQPFFGKNKTKLIHNLKKFKKKIDDKLNGEVDECQYEILEKELLKEIENLDIPLSKEPGESHGDSTSPDMNCGEMVRMKLRNMAFEEGRKIVSKPDPFIERQENVIHRKRLVRELGLKCKKGGPCCTEKIGSSKLILKAAYETKHKQECRCENRLKQLSSLENDFENMRAFIHKHATKKNVEKAGIDFLEALSKRKLTTKYNKSRFFVVWNDFGRQGLFLVNLEAQMMKNERIIIRPQYKKRVKVLSGGRTGLDPLYAEYVCTGMLDGVVLGNERNGPIPRTILQAIKELDSGEGVVIIILNENEERLSFLFAIERARKLGIDAELVLARDDISDHQPEKWRYGRRGHNGIVLQFKVAAGMAAKGYNLAAISRVTQGIHVATLDCYLTKFGPFVGSGIRNDKGYYIPGLQAEDVLSELIKQLMDPAGLHSIVPEPGTKMILFINKFRMTCDEVYSIVSYVGKRILETGAKVGRAYLGNFSTFTRQGFSITMAKDWNDELIQFLDYPTTCVHWPPHLSESRNFTMTRTRFHKEQIIGALISPENVHLVFEILDRTLRETAFSLDRVLECCSEVGVPLLNIIWILKPNLKRLPLDRPYLLLSLIGKVLNVNIPGIGKYFQLLFVAAAQEFMKDPMYVVNWKNWWEALKRGTQSFAGYSKFKIGDGTILDYLMPINDALSNIKEGWSPLPFLFEGLERVNHLEQLRKNDIGIIILGQIFRNLYSCLSEFTGHYPGEFWWKESESMECSSLASSIYSLKDDRRTEPSIEAKSLEGFEGVSIRSAAGFLHELLSIYEHVDDIHDELNSLKDESSSWKFLD